MEYSSIYSIRTDFIDISGTAVFETRVITPDEFDAYRVLMGRGFSFTVKAVDPKMRARGKASPDLLMAGRRWELKCPVGGNTRKTITRNINRAIEQMKNADPPASEISIVLSGLRANLPRENIAYHVEKKLSEGEISEIIVIYSEINVEYYAFDSFPQRGCTWPCG